MSLAQKSFTNFDPPCNSPWSEALDKMIQNHSFQNNYDDNVYKMKMNYKASLDLLSNEKSANQWGVVKVIDFAHAFFNDQEIETVDQNFKEGVTNFIRVLEELLRET